MHSYRFMLNTFCAKPLKALSDLLTLLRSLLLSRHPFTFVHFCILAIVTVCGNP